MFSGAIPQKGTQGSEKNELFIVEPPEKIHTFKYYCGNAFLLDPLEEMLIPNAIFGLFVVGRKQATLGYIKGKNKHIVKHFTSRVQGKHRQGGQSQKRFERLREEGEIAFYRKLSGKFNEFFLSMDNLSGIFIGGSGLSKKKFASDKSIDYRLSPKIIDEIDVQYNDAEKGLNTMIIKTKKQREELKYSSENQVIQRFYRELASDNGLATYGFEDVNKALAIGIVDTLIIVEDSKLLEELAEKAFSINANVETISLNNKEGSKIRNIFGGIVAILRYNSSR